MHSAHDPQRRRLMSTLAALSLAGPASATAASGDKRISGSSSLVAYFSRSGNTRVVAGMIQRTLGADLFEIRPVTPYPEDYAATVAQATRERERGDLPALAGRVEHLSAYDTIFLGFPVWGMTLPAVLRSFLRNHDLAGKTLIPFITHGDYGVGDSLSTLTRLASRATMGRAFVLQCDQERTTGERVMAWMKDSRLRP